MLKKWFQIEGWHELELVENKVLWLGKSLWDVT